MFLLKKNSKKNLEFRSRDWRQFFLQGKIITICCNYFSLACNNIIQGGISFPTISMDCNRRKSVPVIARDFDFHFFLLNFINVSNAFSKQVLKVKKYFFSNETYNTIKSIFCQINSKKEQYNMSLIRKFWRCRSRKRLNN